MRTSLVKVSGRPLLLTLTSDHSVGVGFCGWGPMTDASLAGLGGPMTGRQVKLDVEVGKGILKLRSLVFLSCSSRGNLAFWGALVLGVGGFRASRRGPPGRLTHGVWGRSGSRVLAGRSGWL